MGYNTKCEDMPFGTSAFAFLLPRYARGLRLMGRCAWMASGVGGVLVNSQMAGMSGARRDAVDGERLASSGRQDTTRFEANETCGVSSTFQTS